jgi:hypothetical protein
MKVQNVRCWSLLGGVVMVCWLARTCLGAELWEARLDLANAIWPPENTAAARTLTLKLDVSGPELGGGVEKPGTSWGPMVVGESRGYGDGDHVGWVDAVEHDEQGILGLKVHCRLARGQWGPPGGLASYRLKIRLLPPGEGKPVPIWGGGQGPIRKLHPDERYVVGEWEGVVRGVSGEGEVAGVLLPRPALPGFVPPLPGERPRFLLRRSEISALRQKSQTAWGQEALGKLKTLKGSYPSADAVAQGLIYVLTGERHYADEARQLIQKDMDAGRWYTFGQAHGPAAVVVQSCLAYDLIYDTCDEAFRRRMREMIVERIGPLMTGGDDGRFNGNVMSNWSAMFRSAIGMMALSILDEPVPPPLPPVEPAVLAIASPADLAVGKGVPVVALTSGRAWQKWLFAGPFRVGPEEDALAPLGGALRARPEHGTVVGDRTFIPLDPKFVISTDKTKDTRHVPPEGAIDVAKASGHGYLQTCYLYAVMEVLRPGAYKVEMTTNRFRGSSAVIAGKRVRDGDVVRLEKGRYPVLAWLPLSKTGTWIPIHYRLIFRAMNAEEEAAWLAESQAQYAFELAEWRAFQYYAARDGTSPSPAFSGAASPTVPNPFADRWLRVARQRIDDFGLRAFGEHGWNTEGEAYTQHALRLVFAFAHAYRNTLGRNLHVGQNFDWVLPRYAATTIFGPEGARQPAYCIGGGPAGVDMFARGFGLVPDNLKPVTLHAWNRTQSLADDGKLKNPETPVATLDPVSAVMRLLNYPLDMKEQHPSEVFPKVFVDEQRGGYVFRDRWQNGDDCVAMIFGNTWNAQGGWSTPEAGDLRISGLGADWLVRGGGHGNGGSTRYAPDSRIYHNVLQLGEGAHNGGFIEAPAIWFQPRPDGSGTITLDMNAVYSARTAPEENAPKIKPWRPEALVGYDRGIKGLRAFAVDYSGSSGATALFAIADKLTGSKGENQLHFATEAEHAVELYEDGFGIKAANGASLRATVVAPPQPDLAVIDIVHTHEINYHGEHRSAKFKRKIITVKCADHALVVMTLQRGEAPAVRVKGTGLSATATVGRRTVAFDGQKLLLGERP